MAYKYLGSGLYKGLFSDLATLTNAAPNAIFVATDTRTTYYFQSGIWTQEAGGSVGGGGSSQNASEYYYYVYIDPTDKKAKVLNTITGAVDFTADQAYDATTPDSLDPIKQAIAASSLEPSGTATTRGIGRDIFIAKGEYHHKDTFTGFDLPLNRKLRIHMASAARLYVPSGYAGYVFRFGQPGAYTGAADATLACQACEVKGGMISREGPATYTAFYLYSDGNISNGTYDIHIADTHVSLAENVVKLETDRNLSWINNNFIENISGRNCVNHIVFDQTDAGTTPSTVDLTNYVNSTFNFNRFSNWRFQTDSSNQYGIKNICGKGNMFDHIVFFDQPSGAIAANVTNQAFNTMIYGGTAALTISEKDAALDQGVNTRIVDWDNTLQNRDYNAYRRKGTTENRWYCAGQVNASNLSAGAISPNVLIAMPFVVQRPTKFDTIAVNVTTSGTSPSGLRLGIYADNGNTYPSAMIFRSGNVDTSGIPGLGVKSFTISATDLTKQTFKSGLYWLVYCCGPNAPTIRALSPSGAAPILGLDSTLGTAVSALGWSAAFTYTTLPDPFPSGATELTGSSPLAAIFMRAVS